MSLLRDIQNDLSTKDGDLTTILRKCKILAARLGSAKFSQWVDWELNGYPDGEQTPQYRRLHTGCYANFMNSAYHVDRAGIPWALFEEKISAVLEVQEFRGGIAGIAPFVGTGCPVNVPH